MGKIFILSAFFLVAAASAKNYQKNYEIIPKKVANKLLKQCSRKSPIADKYWTPTNKDIQNLESKFKDCVPESIVILEDYLRQYAGYFHNGKKMIYLSGIKNDLAQGRKIVVPKIICDGDENAFGVEYEVDSQQFLSFEFNGPGGRTIDSTQLSKCKSQTNTSK